MTGASDVTSVSIVINIKTEIKQDDVAIIKQAVSVQRGAEIRKLVYIATAKIYYTVRLLFVLFSFIVVFFW